MVMFWNGDGEISTNIDKSHALYHLNVFTQTNHSLYKELICF